MQRAPMLLGDVEGSLRGDVLFYSGMSRGGFTDIPEIVQTGRAGHSVTLGPEGFNLIGQHPERLDAMHRTMVGRSRWDDEHARKILTSCRDGAGADGVILLIERLLPDRFADIPDHRRFARADLTMMGYGGHERSEGEMFTLLHSAGSRPVRVVGQAWTLSVVEVSGGVTGRAPFRSSAW